MGPGCQDPSMCQWPWKTIVYGNDASPEENAKAMIFLRRHIHEALKSEYVVVDEPLVLWKALCENTIIRRR
ncbi:unnamed protein product [Prunus brigantina]